MSFLKNLKTGIVNMLSGSPYRIDLSLDNKQIFLSTYKGTRNIYLSQLLDKYPELGKLSSWVKADKVKQEIPLENLSQIKKELSSVTSGKNNNQLQVLIDPIIQQLKTVKMPKTFGIHYCWSDSEKVILQKVEGDYFGKGWYVSDNGYWNLPEINANDEIWLNKARIQGQEILELISQVLPEWKLRGLPVKCDLSMGTGPAFLLKINNVEEDSIACEIVWRVKAQNLKKIPSLDDYVLADNFLWEGINPAELSVKLPAESGVFYLKGQEIAVFLHDTLSKIKKWTEGKVAELVNKHRILNGGELILQVERKEDNGVGFAQAVPFFVCNQERIKAEEISQKIYPETKYIRLDSGWYPVENLKLFGLGPMGRLIDGTALNNFPKLTAAEILRRGSERFNGPWRRLEFPEMKLPTGDSPFQIASKHLEFLIQWGIPGGFTGSFGDYEITLIELFTKLLQESPKLRILMVGKKALFDGMSEKWQYILSSRYDGNKKDPELKSNAGGLYAATPNALEAYPALSRAKWDILLILEPDALVKSSTSKLYNNLVSCKASLVLGLFTGMEFHRHQQSFEALSTIFGIQDRDTVWKYGVRNPNEANVTLPPAYRLKYKPITNPKAQGRLAEITLQGDSQGTVRPIPIPPKTEKKVQVSTDQGNLEFVLSIELKTSNSYGSYYNGGSFVQEAKKLVDQVEYKAKFIPFMSYWPTYSSMSTEQQKWYFYWRGQVRKGLYPNTDLSYIFVHVYELINNIGVKDPMDGYRQLYRLWTNYRERHPKLDHYLADWITDYVAMFRCNIDLLQVYRHVADRNAYSFYPDILLANYNKSGVCRLPLTMINLLSDYNVLRSKFYNESGQTLIEEYIPKTIEEINTHLRQKHHMGILDLFQPGQREKTQREPFRSAVHGYKGNQLITIETIPYTRHKPLREFFTCVIKHTENKLREVKGYNGRLRGYTLEPEIRIWIEDYLASEIEGLKPATKPSLKIEIDTTKVKQLIKDSDKVRDMLIIADEKTQAEVTRTPADLLTDLEPVRQLLGELDNQQLTLVRILLEHMWELEDQRLNELLPAMLINSVVDDINEGSLKYLGDLLIATEGNKKVVADDFRDELEYLLPRLEEILPQKPESLIQSLDLPEEWDRFRTSISPYQHQALAAFVAEKDLISEINRIAEECLMMPEILIDAINELALENIGDIIINVEYFPPVINEEYLDLIKKITA